MQGFLHEYQVDKKYGPLKGKFVTEFTKKNQTDFIDSLYSLDSIADEDQGKRKIINTIFNNIYNQLKITLDRPYILQKLEKNEEEKKDDFKTFQKALVNDSNIIFRNLFISETATSRFSLYSDALPNDSQWNREIRNCNKEVLDLFVHPLVFRGRKGKPANSHVYNIIKEQKTNKKKGYSASIGQTNYCNYLGYSKCRKNKKEEGRGNYELCEDPIFTKHWKKKLNHIINLLKEKRSEEWSNWKEMIDDILLALKIILYNIKLNIYGDNVNSVLKVFTPSIGYNVITDDYIKKNTPKEIIKKLDEYDNIDN